ncbi:hypothetical protein KIN20_013713, partial [Parelaphostrongylus tenuis]
ISKAWSVPTQTIQMPSLNARRHEQEHREMSDQTELDSTLMRKTTSYGNWTNQAVE